MKQVGSTITVPYDVEAEEAVLGSIIIDPAALDRVLPFLEAGDFYMTHNGWVYEAILSLREQGRDLDSVTLGSELQRRDRLEETGGVAHIAHLINSVPSALHAESYGRVVEEAAYRRRLLDRASDLAIAAYAGGDDLEERSVAIGQRLMTRGRALNGKGSKRAIERIKAQIRDWADNPLADGGVRGIPTGLRSVDKMLGGLSPSLIICGASTSIGKTAFACQLALNIAGAGYQVLYITREMSTQQVITRMATSRSRVDWRQIEAGTLEEEEIARLMASIDYISGLPLVVDDGCSTITDILAATGGHAKRVGLEFLVVDYLGLYVPREVDYRSLQLGIAAQQLHGLSRREECSVLALHQIGRKIADRKDKRPRLSDLQWSGMLEQDSDIVAFLHRDELNTQMADGSPNPKGRRLELLVRKNRLTGRLGKALLYLGAYTEVRDLEQRAAANAPPGPELIPF